VWAVSLVVFFHFNYTFTWDFGISIKLLLQEYSPTLHDEYFNVDSCYQHCRRRKSDSCNVSKLLCFTQELHRAFVGNKHNNRLLVELMELPHFKRT